MTIRKFNIALPSVSGEKPQKSHNEFNELLAVLRQKKIPEKIVEDINRIIIETEQTMKDSPQNKSSRILLRATKKIINLVVKNSRFVPKKYYLNQWMALGMSVFGIPIGIIFSLAFGNFAYIGIGIPIGMSFGVAIGVHKDQEALNQGRQLPIEYHI